MVATEFALLGELEDEFEQEAVELEPVFPLPVRRALKSRAAEYKLLGIPEFETPNPAAIAAQKKLADFIRDVHLRPQVHRKLILTAHLHPFPRRSRVISDYPVLGDSLSALLLDGYRGSTKPGETPLEMLDAIILELFQLAERNFPKDIEAEHKLVAAATNVIKLNIKTLKPILVEAAMLDQNTLQNKPEELSGDFRKLGLRLAGEQSLQSILDSEANDAHLTTLGWRIARYASMLQKKDSAFRKAVEKERRRRRQ